MDIIVFAIVCIVVDMRKIECTFTSDTALNGVLDWYMHWCVEFENENAFQMHKRLFYSTFPHTYSKYRHTHTRARGARATTNVTMVLIFEIDENFSNVKVRMTTNDARCSVVVEHLAPARTDIDDRRRSRCATLAWIRRRWEGRVDSDMQPAQRLSLFR